MPEAIGVEDEEFDDCITVGFVWPVLVGSVAIETLAMPRARFWSRFARRSIAEGSSL